MISGLHHYALEVPDLEAAEGFLQDFGLETGEKDGNLVAQCPGRDQEQVRMVQAAAPRLVHAAPGHAGLGELGSGACGYARHRSPRRCQRSGPVGA